MKRIVLFSLFLWSAAACVAQFADERFRAASINAEQCEWVWTDRVPHKHIRLEGYVYVAKDGEPYDFLVRKVGENESADMTVGIVKKRPNECCLWQWVSDRKKASFVIKFVTKPGTEHFRVHFMDGEKRRHNTDLPCYDWSSGKPEPCK